MATGPDVYGGGLDGLSAISGIAGMAGMGGGVGNPIALGAAAVGIGLSIYSGIEESKVASEEASTSADIAGLEGKINKVRQAQAGFQYQRQSLQNLRAAQMASHRSRAAAVAQGAQFGSGAAAGEKQASAEAAWNQSQLAGDYLYGQKIFGYTDQIDADKVKLAQLGGDMAKYQGIGSIGSTLTGGAMGLGRLTGGFGSGQN